MWLTADQLADGIANPLGGAGGEVAAAAAGHGLPATVPLDDLAGIYPRPSDTSDVGVGTYTRNPPPTA